MMPLKQRERRPVGEDVGGEPDRLAKLESENDSSPTDIALSPSSVAVLPAEVLGMDGKRYPARCLSDDARRRLVGWVHDRVHGGASYRQVVADLVAEGLPRRSVGWVSSAMSEWTCSECVQDHQKNAPEHGAEVTR